MHVDHVFWMLHLPKVKSNCGVLDWCLDLGLSVKNLTLVYSVVLFLEGSFKGALCEVPAV